MMWALVRKDLAQNARPLLTFALAALGLPLLFALLARTDKNAAGYAGLAFGFLGISAPMLLGQWFIGQEKVKGTFKLLRSMPLSGTKIVMTKYLTCTLICLLLTNIVFLAEPAACSLIGVAVAFPAATIVVWTNAVGILFIAVGIALFTVFDARIATQAIVWGICAFMACVGLAGRYFGGHANERLAKQAEAAIIDVRLATLVALILAVISLLIVLFAAQRFERMEWSQLEEG